MTWSVCLEKSILYTFQNICPAFFIQFIGCYIYQFPFMFFSQYVFLLCRKTIYDMVGEQGITLTRTLVLAVALMALGTVHKWRHNFNFWLRVLTQNEIISVQFHPISCCKSNLIKFYHANKISKKFQKWLESKASLWHGH